MQRMPEGDAEREEKIARIVNALTCHSSLWLLCFSYSSELSEITQFDDDDYLNNHNHGEDDDYDDYLNDHNHGEDDDDDDKEFWSI